MLTRKDIKALLAALLKTRSDGAETVTSQLDDFFCRQLGNGYSGAFVALVWLDQLPTIILKAGPARAILDETEARSHFDSPGLESIRALGLSGCSDPVEIEVNGRDESWRAMAYTYIGGLTYEDLPSFSDFQAVFEDFVAPQRDQDKPSAQALRSWLDRLCDQIQLRETGASSASVNRRVRAKPLAEFLPALPWDRGLTAALMSAAAYAPASADFLSFRDWWDRELSKESIAAFPVTSLVHGDLRFANVLVNRTTAEVELIDFGSAVEGHVFRDLARFECDLLLNITPPSVESNSLQLSSEDRRLRALELAFDPKSGQLRDQHDPGNPILASLAILLEVYDKYWTINSNPARRRMYQWFLLAEILKRLMWTDDVFTKVENRRALLISVDLLKRGIAGRTVTASAFSSVSDLSRLLNCTRIYVPARGFEASVNRRRNADKINALQKAAASGSPVKLLAETGNSYLHFRGPLYPEVETLITAGSLQVVLINPDFTESHGISAAYKEPSNVDDFGVHPLLRQKFEESLTGYAALRASAQANIDVRIARYGIGGTLLITEDEMFFEPYFRSDRRRRHRRMFETFEFRFGPNGHISDLLNEHFAFHWSNSDAVIDFLAARATYRTLMREVSSTWRPADA